MSDLLVYHPTTTEDFLGTFGIFTDAVEGRCVSPGASSCLPSYVATYWEGTTTVAGQRYLRSIRSEPSQ
jgi:hypothetical protein